MVVFPSRGFPTSTAYLGLGSNLGDRHGNLSLALERLNADNRIRVLSVAPFIETAPVGGPSGQPAYINSACGVKTSLDPLELLAVLQNIEMAFGRDRTKEIRWGPRTLDIDILLWDDSRMDSEILVIPHPRLAERRFVLEPLCAIAPGVRNPANGKTVREMLADLDGGT